MKVFSHGSNVNFQTSTREMFFPDLESLLQDKIRSAQRLILGTINPHKEQLFVYGQLNQVTLTESTNILQTEDEELILDPDQFLLSQEAIFTITDETKGQIDVEVLYLTYDKSGEESIYFLFDEEMVTHPMSCVVQFYEQVKEIGRDVDFSLSGCTAHEWKPNH